MPHGLGVRDVFVLLATGVAAAAVVMVLLWYAYAGRLYGQVPERRRSAKATALHVAAASVWSMVQVLKGAYSYLANPDERWWRAYAEVALNLGLVVSLLIVLRSVSRGHTLLRDRRDRDG